MTQIEECEHCSNLEGVNKLEDPFLKEIPTDEALSATKHGSDDVESTVLRTIRKTGTPDILESGLRRTNLRFRNKADSGQRRSSESAMNQASSAKVHAKYSLRQAFFITMGGVAIETKDIDFEPYLILTAAGALELAKLGLLSPPPEDVIGDKTKADPITKVVVSVQAGWFIVQCIGRIAQHLPLTLLEVHVLAHVIVALIMYLIWFSKPYNVSNPLVLDSPDVLEAGAFFLLHRQPKSMDARYECEILEAQEEHTRKRRNLWVKEAEEGRARCVVQSDIDLRKAIQAREILCSQYYDRGDHRSDIVSIENHIGDLPTAPAPTKNVNDEEADIDAISSGPASGKHRHSDEGTAFVPPPGLKERGEAHPTAPFDDILIEDLPRRWRQDKSVFKQAANHLRLAEGCLQRLRSQSFHIPYYVFPNGGIELSEICLVDYIFEYDENPAGSLLQRRTGSDRTPKGMEYSLTPSAPESNWLYVLIFCYSAFHLSAWNAHFPTTVERWMWRGAGLAFLAYPIMILPLVLMRTDVRAYKNAYARLAQRSRTKFAALFVVLLIPHILLMIWFFLGLLHWFIVMPIARVYFLVEAFASFRDPELRVYDTVQWTKFWPHG